MESGLFLAGSVAIETDLSQVHPSGLPRGVEPQSQDGKGRGACQARSHGGVAGGDVDGVEKEGQACSGSH